MATGDIYEDIPQAQQAAREGADVIAVIRSTGQSLLDYVPEGPTREGFAGTYATQENFRLMRAALDETSRELGRYVRLTNYASGLCMPEIAALAGLERLDMMLNDSMYGILFRDINPVRTFVDQRFSRQVHARAGIIINTGEDNYLTTADAVEAAHTVTTSQLLNEYFAKEAGLEDWQLGLGHAFEIDPDGARHLPDGARARAAGPRAVPEGAAEVDAADPAHDRRRLPRLPARRVLQPRRGAHRPGHPARRDDDRGRGDAVAQSDRDLALQNVRYVMEAAGALHEDFRPAPDGFIAQRARQVLGESIDLLDRIVDHDRRPARRDRRRHLRPDEAPGRRRPGARGRREEGRRLLQPGDRDPGGRASERLGRPQATASCGRTATRPATAWCSCRFTLPMPHSKVAEGAAVQLANKMGMDPALVVHAKPMGPDFTFFVVYGRVQPPRRPVGRSRSWSATTSCSRPRRSTRR